MRTATRTLRIPGLQRKKQRGEKITMLTAYNCWMARLLSAQGDIDLLLVGDSLSMVELGYDSTIPVTMEDMVRHTRAVRNGAPHAFVVADLPFLAYQVSVEEAMRNAGRLMQDGGANAVKLEGGASVVPTVKRIVDAGIPVVGHLGLLPQSVNQLGGYRQQATTPEEQQRLLDDALALEASGAFALVLECVPAAAAAAVTKACRIPVIGIGAGNECDGQVLVTHDLLGLGGETSPPFAKRYVELGEQVTQAVANYADEVRRGVFPPVRPESAPKAEEGTIKQGGGEQSEGKSNG